MLRSKLIFFVIIVLLITLYTGGCRRMGKWLVKEDIPEHTDAMVLLMGDFPDRVLQAADLYHNGVSGKVIIVQESMGPFQRLEERGARIVSNSEQARNSLIELGLPEENITILPGDARSTLDEAVAVREYLAQNTTIDTIILVSASSHMRRASMIFRRALREQVPPPYIGSSPSIYSNFNAGIWWRKKDDIQNVLGEFVKMGSFVLFERRKI